MSDETRVFVAAVLTGWFGCLSTLCFLAGAWLPAVGAGAIVLLATRASLPERGAKR